MTRRRDAAGSIPVRHGAALAHVRDPQQAALLMRELQGGLDQACRTGTCCREVLGGQAQRVLGAATALVATVGGSTLAQGLARLRVDGQRVPPHLVRAWRELDAASALIRHPGAAERIVEVANSWLMQAVPVKFADAPHDAASDEAFASTGSVGAVATTDINAESDMCDSDPEDELQKGVNDKKGEKTQMVQDMRKMKAAFGYKSEQDMDDRLLKLEVKNVVVTNIVSEGPAGSSEGTADHSTDERCSLDGDPHAGVNAIDRTQLAGTVCSTQCTATPSDTASQSRLLEYLTNHEAALLSGCSEGHAAGAPPPCLDTNALGMWNTMGVMDEAPLDEAVPPWECDDPEDDEGMRAHKRRFRARLKRS
ncbi:unnamed protein product [Prorocentrum cordatum]|uniref:Uncharacterized protein n=1 Tax=Prorocentrum cordatum TaxID=2364126 RepID=A0ABN9UTA8_9DINO|nr:unnamed protein product [Polarella glacialis]